MQRLTWSHLSLCPDVSRVNIADGGSRKKFTFLLHSKPPVHLPKKKKFTCNSLHWIVNFTNKSITAPTFPFNIKQVSEWRHFDSNFYYKVQFVNLAKSRKILWNCLNICTRNNLISDLIIVLWTTWFWTSTYPDVKPRTEKKNTAWFIENSNQTWNSVCTCDELFMTEEEENLKQEDKIVQAFMGQCGLKQHFDYASLLKDLE